MARKSRKKEKVQKARAKSLLVYVTWVALRPMTEAQAKVVGKVKSQEELDKRLAEIRSGKTNRGRNHAELFEQAKYLTFVDKELWFSMEDPFITGGAAKTRPQVKVYDELPKKMLEEMKRTDPEALKRVKNVERSGRVKFKVLSVQEIPAGTKEYTQWSKRLLARTAALNTSHLSPIDLWLPELSPGSCVKSSLLSLLGRSQDKKAPGLAERIARDMPDGALSAEDALAWMARVGDAYVFDQDGTVMAQKPYVGFPTEPKAAKPFLCETCGRGFQRREGLSQHKCPGVRVTCSKCRSEFKRASDMERHEATCGTPSRENAAVKRLGIVVHDGHASPVTHVKSLEQVKCHEEPSVECRELKPRTQIPEMRRIAKTLAYEGLFEFPGPFDDAFGGAVAIAPGTYSCDSLLGAVRELLWLFVPTRIHATSGRLTSAEYAHSSGKPIRLTPAWSSVTEQRQLLDRELELYRQARNRIDPWLRHRTLRAQYGPGVDWAFETWGKAHRMFGGWKEDAWALDVRKHFSSVLAKMTYVPVPSGTDRFFRVDAAAEIRDGCWYIVHASPKTFAQRVYFGLDATSICLGEYLKVDWVKDCVDAVLAELQPTTQMPIDLKDVVHGIYADFPERVAKDAVNHALGKAGVVESKDTESKLFTVLEEAQAHAQDTGAVVRTLGDGHWYTHREKRGRYEDGWKWSLWVAHQEHAVFDMASRAQELGRFEPYAIKSDSLYFYQRPEVEPGDGIGEFKPVAREATPGTREREKKPPNASLLQFPLAPEWIDVPVEAVRDPEVKSVMLQAVFPGSGKSYAWESYARDNPGKKFLVVAAQHSTLRDVRSKLPEADISLSTSVSFYRQEVFNVRAKRKFQVSDFDVLVLEEAGLFDTPQLREMVVEMDKLPCRVIVTMDKNQLAPVNDKWYDTEAVERIFMRAFKHRVYLTENRTLAPKDHPTMYRLKELNDKGDLKGMIAEVKTWSEPVTYQDVKAGKVPGLRIGHTRAVASLTSNAIGLDKEIVYRGKKSDLVKNNIYRVVGDGEIECTLNLERFKVDRERITRDFEHADSVTYYGSQGRRTDGQVLLMDIDSPMQSCQALWMAVFRARDFAKVRVVTGVSAEINAIFKILEAKIKSYKKQDLDRGLDPGKNFTKEQGWEIMKAARFRCTAPECEAPELDMLDSGAWCFDRKNELPAHTAENCQLSCTKCNSKKAGKEHRR